MLSVKGLIFQALCCSNISARFALGIKIVLRDNEAIQCSSRKGGPCLPRSGYDGSNGDPLKGWGDDTKDSLQVLGQRDNFVVATGLNYALPGIVQCFKTTGDICHKFGETHWS